MKIADLRLTGLAGGTVEGGWAEELQPQDNINTVVEVITDEGLVGLGSAMTSAALVEAEAKLPVRFVTWFEDRLKDVRRDRHRRTPTILLPWGQQPLREENAP
jgi:hypothetical protein